MTLDECRQRLNEIDGRMLSLFEDRMDIVREVARIKQASGLPVRDEAQEQRKMKAASAHTKDEYRPYAEQLLKSLFALSRAYQERLRAGDIKTP